MDKWIKKEIKKEKRNKKKKQQTFEIFKFWKIS